MRRRNACGGDTLSSHPTEARGQIKTPNNIAQPVVTLRFIRRSHRCLRNERGRWPSRTILTLSEEWRGSERSTADLRPRFPGSWKMHDQSAPGDGLRTSGSSVNAFSFQIDVGWVVRIECLLAPSHPNELETTRGIELWRTLGAPRDKHRTIPCKSRVFRWVKHVR